MDLPKTEFPQNGHYNLKLSKSSLIFPERHKILVQIPSGTKLAFGFPNCQGPCFPTAVPKHWGSCVFPSWTGWRFNKLQQTDTRKQNRNRKQGCTCTISWRAQSKEGLTWELLGGWDHSELNGLQVAPGLLTHLGVAGVCLLWVPWNVKGSEIAKVKITGSLK